MPDSGVTADDSATARGGVPFSGIEVRQLLLALGLAAVLLFNQLQNEVLYSVDLLRRAVAIAHEAGYVVGNVDVTVVLERPKIKGYVESMRQVIADAVRVPIECVGIKGKTNEGVDAVGRGEAVAAHATALLRRL